MSDGVESKAAPEKGAAAERLVSLDTLRGFDMFWITGGEGIVHALAALTGWTAALWCSGQLRHVRWEGFHAYDLIFPLFLFLSGVTMPLTITRRLDQGTAKSKIFWRIFRRMLLLVVLGLIYNGFLRFKFDGQRYYSVLGLIGIAYFQAALVVMFFGWRVQLGWCVAVLVGYFLAMRFIPVPDFDPTFLENKGGNLAAYLDRTIFYSLPDLLHLPRGNLYGRVFDPEGLMGTIPASGLALLGALAGRLLVTKALSEYKKVLLLGAAGLLCLILGYVWGLWFPMIKALWTSSFILFAGGWSFLLLAAFYLVIDVWKIRFWTLPFVVLGMNSITIYMIAHKRLIDFDHLANFFFGGLFKSMGQDLQSLLLGIAIVVIEFFFLYFLYRKKIFLRV
jgi:predicted acyltransferase